MTFSKANNIHLGIDYVEKLPKIHDNKIFFAIHRGMEDLSLQIEGVILPMDGDIY